MKIINPATEEVISEIEEDTVASLEQKLRLLRNAQTTWSQTPLQLRIGILQKFSRLLSENIESLARILTSEVGKPLQQSRNEINGAVIRIQWLTDHAEKYLADEVMRRQQGWKKKYPMNRWASSVISPHGIIPSW